LLSLRLIFEVNAQLPIISENGGCQGQKMSEKHNFDRVHLQETNGKLRPRGENPRKVEYYRFVHV